MAEHRSIAGSVHHVSFRIDDLEASLGFNVDALGFQ